jgi:hypothetical protein
MRLTQQLQDIRPTCRSGGRSKLFEIQSSQLALTEKTAGREVRAADANGDMPT